MKNSAEAI